MNPRRRPDTASLALLASITVLLGGALATAELAGLRYNPTPSVPRGLYRETDHPPGRGDLVFFCLDARTARLARARGYVRAARDCPADTAPLLKPIAALPGDLVKVSPAGVEVNGRLIPNTAPRTRDSAGRPLATAPGGPVPRGTVWILSQHSPASFDSRYFGPVPVERILSTAEPVALLD